MEKYMTFSVGQLQFIDSLQFMNGSLEKLATNLQMEDLVITRQGVTDKELVLLRRMSMSAVMSALTSGSYQRRKHSRAK